MFSATLNLKVLDFTVRKRTLWAAESGRMPAFSAEGAHWRRASWGLVDTTTMAVHGGYLEVHGGYLEVLGRSSGILGRSSDFPQEILGGSSHPYELTKGGGSCIARTVIRFINGTN